MGAKAKAKAAADSDDDDDSDDEPAPKAKAKAKAKAAADEDDEDDEDDDEEEAQVSQKSDKMKKKIDLGSSSKEASSEELTVFVGGLPFSTSEEQIKKDFEECGEVTKFVLPKNDEGQPRGIAFITYASKAGVDAALKFDGDDYGGRTLKVNLAGAGKGKGKDGKGKGKDGKGKGKDGKGKDRNDDLTVKVTGLSWELSQETVEKDFKECGEVTRV